MLTCIDCDTMQCITAENCYDVSKSGFVCVDCHCPVVLVLEKSWPVLDKNLPSHPRFFRHKVANPTCGHTLRNPSPPETSVSSSPTLSSSSLSEAATVASVDDVNRAWQEQWNRLRPTPRIASESHNYAVVLQDRDYPEEPPITIFNATQTELFAYGTFQHKKQPIFFCSDNGIESPKDGTVLVHCSDNRLLQTCSESVLVMMGQRQITVRFLTQMDDAMKFAVQDYFQGVGWPPRPLQIVKCTPFELPLHVISVEGRLFIDGVHREAFRVFPSQPLTVYAAPAGAGKSSALKQAIWAWKKKRVLVLVFNKSNQESLKEELKSRKGCTIRTLDALVGSVMKCRYQATYDEGMDFEEAERNAIECNDICENNMEETDPTLDNDDSDSIDADGDAEVEDDTLNDDDNTATMNVDDIIDEESDVEFDSNFNDHSFSNKHYKKWDSRDHLKHGGGLCAASLIQNRLSHPKAIVHICKKHQRLSLKHAGDNANPWKGELDVFPMKRIVDAQSNFAARRFHADKNGLLKPIFDKYDVVMVDERQDVFSAQEIRLILQSECPVVAVGDTNQAINSFKDQINTYGCDMRAPCIFPGEVTEKIHEIPWYTTYRLDPITVAFVEDICNIRMVSKRSDLGVVRWGMKISEPNTLVMTRKNENVVKLAILYKNHGIRVLSGIRIAGMLKGASASTSHYGMAKIAKNLQKDGQLGAVVKLLIERDISLTELKNNPVFAVACLHGVKGFETNNTAIHSDLIEASKKETESNSLETCERNCLFVAISRHIKSLTILIDIPVPIVTLETGKVQSTLDLSTFIYKKD